MRSTSMLRRRLLTRDGRVAVVGQGYVGLSLACAAAEAGFEVTGIDVDADRADALAAGRLVVPGVDEATFKSGVATGRLRFTADDAGLATSDVICICVPTPVRDHTPDLSYVEQACRDVARHLVAGRLVVLESSTYPGPPTTWSPPCWRRPGSGSGATSCWPTRPSGSTPATPSSTSTPPDRRRHPRRGDRGGGAVLRADDREGDPLSSARAAELAKLLENTFRHVNIALANEMAMVCHELGIDVWEVIEAAASKPFGFMAFTPGPGVGGHCIPARPDLPGLAGAARRRPPVPHPRAGPGRQRPHAGLGRGPHRRGPQRAGQAAQGGAVLVLGVAYKPDVGDVRESPSLRVMQALAAAAPSWPSTTRSWRRSRSTAAGWPAPS